ncbi:MAG TPA: low affinity iron permease family protein [Aquabacterium sp.]|nr:low affinity iron permease family protein [Aquabacterium sp.]
MRCAQWYSSFSRSASRVCGRSGTFALAVVLIVVWAVTGPLFGFSDTWQLTVNTGTTIVTFLMVFLIQNTQSRDTEAIQVKLDELIRATQGAHNVLLDVEDLDEGKLADLREHYLLLARQARAKRAARLRALDAAAGEAERAVAADVNATT